MPESDCNGTCNDVPETTPGRTPGGRFQPGNVARLTHGVRRYQLRGTLPAHIRDVVDAFRTGLEADRGGADEMGAIEKGYVKRLSQLEAAIELLTEDLNAQGVMTQRGRPRAAYMTFLRTIESWDRLAQRLGLARKAKRVQSLADAMQEVVE